MRKVAILAGMLLLTGMTAAAQDSPGAEVAFGYSYLRLDGGFNSHGGFGSIAGYPNSWFGLVGDFGGYKVTESGIDAKLFTYMFGPRVTYRTEAIQPFAQVLFGGARLSEDISGVSVSENAFAMAAGGGLDIKATDRVAIRVIQAEWLMTRFSSDTQNNTRISAGLVFRF